MSTADVEAVGAHCQMPFCHQLDFLPFRCESCRGKFCLDHRSESAHTCPKAGEWARRRREATYGASNSNIPTKPKPSILTHEQQCAQPNCKILIHTALVTGVHCDKCRREYCLKHRFGQDHDCANLKPLGASSSGGAVSQKERGLAALEKLRAWGAGKKTATTTTSSSKSSSSSGAKSIASSLLPQSKAKQSAAASLASLNALKRSATGDAKTPQDQRVYLHVEASADTIRAKSPKGAFFYSSAWSVGRVLDVAAKGLQVENINNRSESEEDRLRVFWVEGGRLLEFGEKLGATVKTGDTIVLLRGVGAGMASTPEHMA